MAADQLVSVRERIDEAVAIVEASDELGGDARLLGGVAVVLHCQEIHREPDDTDVIVSPAGVPALTDALVQRGWEPRARFNAAHGDRRLLFDGPTGKLDAFVGAFEMCHRIDLRERLGVEARTLSVADLLLTKLQIVELTEKDHADIRTLLSAHDVGTGPGDHVDGDRIAGALADDWGLWRTVTENLRRIGELEPGKAGSLLERIDAVPKSRRFRMRARIGERRRWYELPEAVGE